MTIKEFEATWHHVAIAVQDMEGMVAFLTRNFGFTIAWDHEHRSGAMMDAVVGLKDVDAHIVMLEGFGVQIELFHYWNPQGQNAMPERQCDFGITHFCLSVKQIHKAYQDLCKKGVTFNCPPQSLREGVWVTYLKGPEGLTIELMEYE
ncbi:MAG: hypothetical protein HOE30_06020 [Deltaproteobacteria bacterium]|nr:hypothetical protein [Deltaproteobacteria bacterium]